MTELAQPRQGSKGAQFAGVVLATMAWLAFGFSIWAHAGFLSNGTEPWDQPGAYHFGWQLVVGVAIGLVWRLPIVGAWLSFIAGQCAAILAGTFVGVTGTGMNFFIPLGLIALVKWSLPFLAGVGAGRGGRWLGLSLIRTWRG